MRPYRKKRELANWIRRKLGQPVVDALIDTTQIDDCIDQATDFFGEHAGGVGNEDSIVLISPEVVLYDGTGNPTQPAPTKGRWRKDATLTVPTTGVGISGVGTSGTSACPPSDCGSVNTKHIANPLPACVNPMPTDINGVPCQVETSCRGPGWCGDDIQAPHCFTETEKGDPDAQGPYWVDGDTTSKPSKQGFVFKSVYDVPKDIIAVHQHLGVGYFGTGQMAEGGEALFSPLHLLMGGGGNWGMQSPNAWVDNRYGYWHGAQGGFVDIVGWEMGMQYLEMFHTLYSVKMSIQLLELEHKVRITPQPTMRGVIAFAATRRVPDEALYNHQWVREYAQALAMIQVGMNGAKYAGASFLGGGSFNSELFLSRGDALREKLEEQISSGMYSEPPGFFMG